MPADATLSEPYALSDDDDTVAVDPRIARAEQRLCMLRELAELGMEMTRALVRQNLAAADTDPDGDADANPPAPPPLAGPRRDPADAFARLSRAVRLTLALEAKTDDNLAALRAGPVGGVDSADPVAAATRDYPLVANPGPPRPAMGLAGVDYYHGAYRNDYVEAGVELSDFNARPLPKDYPSDFRNKVRDRIFEVMNNEIGDADQAREIRDDLYERLWEGERYDAFLHRPLKDAVTAICEDLGLNPDWSFWTEEGWAFPPGGVLRRWEKAWILNGRMKPKPRVHRWGALKKPRENGASP